MKPVVSDRSGPLLSLAWALDKLAQGHGVVIDTLRMESALRGSDPNLGLQVLWRVIPALGYEQPVRLTEPDRAKLPLLAHVAQYGWGLVVECEPDGRWRFNTSEGSHLVTLASLAQRCVVVRFGASSSGDSGGGLFSDIFRHAMLRYRGSLFEAMLASAFIGLLALVTSLFSMQVYDRVIPTRGEYTLAVLALGVAMTILIELAMKFARSHIMDHVTIGLDGRLSREIFQHLLNLRVDQIPASVGSLAGQLRGYEQVRGFYTASTLFALIDVPMAIIFLLVIAVIASPWVALVPLAFSLVAFGVGLLARKRINRLAVEGARYSNMKTGLLVEAVEGVETIKSNSGGWKLLSRWLQLNSNTIQNDMKVRHSSDSITYFAGSIQQLSYAGVVVVGSLIVISGDMTMGALIACSILSGRILTPIITLPSLMVQHAHAKAAMDGLNKLYQLKTDNHGISRVLIPTQLQGHYNLEHVVFSYAEGPAALNVNALTIRPGERVGILGPIGSGKSTLLRLLSGMYIAETGRVQLDGLDISHVSREVINRHVGYLQQEHRLFQGTLRENLLIGLVDPGDEVIFRVMARTGMAGLVQAHPRGLDRVITEGGKGLSGGQRQLVAFTRMVLANSAILLLDEPTANMDQQQEVRCLGILAQEAKANKTMVIVTHKPTLLPLVDRLIIISGSRIIMDGPRDEILRKLTPHSSLGFDSQNVGGVGKADQTHLGKAA